MRALLIVMVAVWNSPDDYLFILWFPSIFYLFSRPMSAAAHWMSTILPHLVWPYSAVAEAEKGFKIRRYPYRWYNKLKMVSF